jgi:hypothetical protein
MKYSRIKQVPMSWQLPASILEKFLHNSVAVEFANTFSSSDNRDEPSLQDLTIWVDTNAIGLYAIEKNDAFKSCFYFYENTDLTNFIKCLEPQ